ncbi:unnamed protein product, partial [Discosporangium mesarthrocarpum]
MTIDVVPTLLRGDDRLAHDGWVTEFEAFQSSAEGFGNASFPVAPSTARSKKSTRLGDVRSATEDLQAEMKLLHWHRLANEAALKAALLKTKKIKAQGGGFTKLVPAATTLAMPIEERAAWMQQVIEEEQSKPLQVSKDMIKKYEAEERLHEERLDKEIAGHIQSLRNLRQQVEKRGEMRARHSKYRTAQKALEAEREQLLMGKVCMNPQGEASPREGGGRGTGTGNQSLKAGVSGKVRTVGTLNTVLGSLDKLVEIERRISSLERSNVYDDFCMKQNRAEGRVRTQTGGRAVASLPRSASGQGQGKVPQAIGRVATGGTGPGGGRGLRSRCGRLSYTKQRTEASIKAPSQSFYTVRINPNRSPGYGCSDRLPPVRGGAVPAGPREVTAEGAGASRGEMSVGAQAFLTALPDMRGARGRSGCVRSRPGLRVFRSAALEKKRREAKRRMASEKAEALRVARQDRIIREWMQRKKVAAAAATAAPICATGDDPSAVSMAGAGAPQGLHGRNTSQASAKPRCADGVHMQEFNAIRASYSRRKEALRREQFRQ